MEILDRCYVHDATVRADINEIVERLRDAIAEDDRRRELGGTEYEEAIDTKKDSPDEASPDYISPDSDDAEKEDEDGGEDGGDDDDDSVLISLSKDAERRERRNAQQLLETQQPS